MGISIFLAGGGRPGKARWASLNDWPGRDTVPQARPKGRREGTAIVDYVVEEQGDRVLKAFKTQAEAIAWAKSEGHSPHVARVRHLNDKKIPDHWRQV